MAKKNSPLIRFLLLIAIAASWGAISALAALSIIGTTIAFIFFYALLERAEPSYMSMAIYLLPIFGALLGVIVLGEALFWYNWIGFGFVLVGVAIVNGYVSLGRFKPAEQLT